MKPAAFRYRAVDSIDGLLAALAEEGDAAQIIAGGQSLVPMMALRLASPEVLVDINPVAELAGIRPAADGVEIGALTRYRALEADAAIPALIRQALPLVAHPAIRNRGTLGGSLALADPAAEMPACMLCLEARMVLGSVGHRREVAARDFFRGLYQTAIQPGEALLAVRIPRQERRTAIREVARRHGDYAIAGIAASARVEDGRLLDVRLACFGIAERAQLLPEAATLLENDPAASAAALSDAIARDVELIGDDANPVPVRRHLAGVMAKRTALDLLAPSPLAFRALEESALPAGGSPTRREVGEGRGGG